MSIAQAATAPRDRIRIPMPGSWGWTLARGALALILGVLAILFPASALFAFTLVFAAFLLVDGILSVAAGVRGVASRSVRRWAYALRGAAGILVALLFVLMPYMMTIGYAAATLILLAAWSITAGILEIAAALRLRKKIEGEWLLALSGVLSVLLGLGVVVLFALYPLESILSVAWLIGIYALTAGIILVFEGVRLKKQAAEKKGDSLASA
jgi:uncharacterized membrane protein HdeD (DUF308 family)